jgi:hypothetical protein
VAGVFVNALSRSRLACFLLLRRPYRFSITLLQRDDQRSQVPPHPYRPTLPASRPLFTTRAAEHWMAGLAKPCRDENSAVLPQWSLSMFIPSLWQTVNSHFLLWRRRPPGSLSFPDRRSVGDKAPLVTPRFRSQIRHDIVRSLSTASEIF